MGSNLPMSFVYKPLLDNKDDMLALLDECSKYDMKLIINDARTSFRALSASSEKEFVQSVRKSYEDFGHHPATYGFFVGDEPSLDEVNYFISALRILKEEMPDLTPFGNVVPYWGGCDYEFAVGRGERFFDDVVDKILSESAAPLLGYDYYAQCLQEGYNSQVGIDAYFYGLDKFRELTQKHNVPFYVSLLSVGHWCFRIPTEDDIRWQIYTSIAHGAKGILWFYVHQSEYESSFRGGPFFGKEQIKTEMFDYIKRQQHIFNNYFKDTLDKMEMTAVYHIGHFYNPAKRFCSDDYIEEVIGNTPDPVIITYYKEYDSGNRWISVVNGHQRISNKITVKFTNGKALTFWLAPGEMKLLPLNDIFGKN